MNPISEIIHIEHLKETIEAQSKIIEYYKKKCKRLSKIISSDLADIAKGSPQDWFYFSLSIIFRTGSLRVS